MIKIKMFCKLKKWWTTKSTKSDKYLIVALIICELSISVYFWLPKSNKLTMHWAIPEKTKPKQGGGSWGYTFMTPSLPWNFQVSYFTPGNCRQNKALPLETPENCVTLLRNFKAFHQDPWKFHMIFSWAFLEIPRCF